MSLDHNGRQVGTIQLAQDYLDVQFPQIEDQAANLTAHRSISGCALRRTDIVGLDENAQDVIAAPQRYLKEMDAPDHCSEFRAHGLFN